MKTLIAIFIVLLALGCGKPELSEAEKLEEQNRMLKAKLENDKLKADLEPKTNPVKELTLREKVVGTYERKNGGRTYKKVLLDNGEAITFGGTRRERKWTIVDNEVHIGDFLFDAGRKLADAYKINPDNSISKVANFLSGVRNDKPYDQGETYKKIK